MAGGRPQGQIEIHARGSCFAAYPAVDGYRNGAGPEDAPARSTTSRVLASVRAHATSPRLMQEGRSTSPSTPARSTAFPQPVPRHRPLARTDDGRICQLRSRFGAPSSTSARNPSRSPSSTRRCRVKGNFRQTLVTRRGLGIVSLGFARLAAHDPAYRNRALSEDTAVHIDNSSLQNAQHSR